MFPELFSIGPFTLHTYGLLVAVGFFAALLVTRWVGRREGFSPQQTMDMGFLIIVAAVVGSRLLFVLINPGYFLQHPLDTVKIWQGGLVFSGGLVAGVAVIFWYARRHDFSMLHLGDLWSPAIALGQAIGRIGCLMAGCCYGQPTGHFWGITFSDPHALAPLGIPLHPTQLYSALSGFIIFGILMFISARKAFTGQVFLWFLILHSTARLWIERYRWDDRGLVPGTTMTITQLVTLLVLIGAVIALLRIKARSKRPPS